MKPKQKRKSKGNNLWLIAGGFMIVFVVAWFTLRDKNESPATSATYTNLPTPPVVTLSPERFPPGRTRDSYQAAKEIPQILAQLPCYCGCMNFAGHKNNLDCFVDNHATDCDICQRIAIDAREMSKSGTPMEQIKDTIRSRYSKYVG